MNIKMLFLSIAAISTMSLATVTFAADVDGHGHTKDHGIAVPKQAHAHGQGQAHTEETHYAAPEFASTKEAWGYITENVIKSDALLAEGRLDEAHEIGEGIKTAIQKLEENAAGATDGKLISALRQLEKSADELHHMSEAGDADGVAMGFKKIKGLIPLVKATYPEGEL